MYKSTSELGTPLYTGQPAGFRPECPLPYSIRATNQCIREMRLKWRSGLGMDDGAGLAIIIIMAKDWRIYTPSGLCSPPDAPLQLSIILILLVTVQGRRNRSDCSGFARTNIQSSNNIFFNKNLKRILTKTLRPGKLSFFTRKAVKFHFDG